MRIVYYLEHVIVEIVVLIVVGWVGAIVVATRAFK